MNVRSRSYSGPNMVESRQERYIMANSSMQGKVCLVTGTSAGIGKVTARELARMGATVVMICRNRAKGEAVQAEIKEASGNDKVDLRRWRTRIDPLASAINVMTSHYCVIRELPHYIFLA